MGRGSRVAVGSKPRARFGILQDCRSGDEHTRPRVTAHRATAAASPRGCARRAKNLYLLIVAPSTSLSSRLSRLTPPTAPIPLQNMSSAPPTSLANTTTLSNGVVMPLIGFGCAGKLNHVPIAHAIRAGYRLFDTSQATEWYLEESLGEALRHSGVPLPREEVFLTTKLHPRDLGEQSTLDAFPNSLKNLHTAYIDAFLLHYPRCFGTLCPPNGGQPAGTWRDSCVRSRRCTTAASSRRLECPTLARTSLTS